ncbi:MAG: biotin synthase BioB [Thermodesulfobacteriota bacterium]
MEEKNSSSFWLELARRVAAEGEAGEEIVDVLVNHPQNRVMQILPGTDFLRRRFFGSRIRLCSILNARSGTCSEDCAFCAQSTRSRAEINKYSLLSTGEMIEPGKACAGAGIDRYSLVTSGRGMGGSEMQPLLPVFRELRSEIKLCASLGIASRDDLSFMKSAGLSRYHHNLETSPDFFGRVCSTHGFEERVETVRAAKRAGLSVCSGGVFGIGESDQDVALLGMVLRDLDVDAVPVNFLVPVPGTPLSDICPPSALRCLKIIALLRFILPDKEIIVCGGRMENLGELHPFIFQAGASGLMTGNYLTVRGRTAARDISMIRSLGLSCA